MSYFTSFLLFPDWLFEHIDLGQYLYCKCQETAQHACVEMSNACNYVALDKLNVALDKYN